MEDTIALFTRKPRSMEDLLNDPEFPFRAARLLGAAEMVAYWLTLQEDQDLKSMGDRLSAITEWFVEHEPLKPTPKDVARGSA